MAETQKRIWDLPVRLTHWGLVISFFGAFFTSEGILLPLHVPFAFMLMTLAIFRVFWGLFGSETARFSQFVRGYGAIKAYAAELKQLRHKSYWGHNPLGAVAILSILSGIFVVVIAGLYAQGGDLVGPMADTVQRQTSRLLTNIHIIIANLVMAIVVGHIFAVFAYKYVLKDNLITPMITGTRPANADQPEPRFTPLPVAVILLVVAASISSLAFGYWGLI